MIVEKLDGGGIALGDGLVRVYDGSADSVVCLATTTIRERLDAARE